MHHYEREGRSFEISAPEWTVRRKLRHPAWLAFCPVRSAVTLRCRSRRLYQKCRPPIASQS